MARYDAADLLAKVRSRLRRPDDDEHLTTASINEHLTRAQEHWARAIAAIIPHVMYGPLVQMVTQDDGATYLFGLDGDDEPLAPLGQAEVRLSANGRVLYPGSQDDPRTDFILEGDRIRIRPGAGIIPPGPVARFVIPPGIIDADHEPSLKPREARVLLIERACQTWAEETGLANPAVYEAQETRLWFGRPEVGDYGLLGAFQRQYAYQGFEAKTDGDGAWWRTLDTGRDYPTAVVVGGGSLTPAAPPPAPVLFLLGLEDGEVSISGSDGTAPPEGDTLATATVEEWRADGRAFAENGWPLSDGSDGGVTITEADVASVAVLVNGVEQGAWVESHIRPRADGTLRAVFVQVPAAAGDVVSLVKGARTVARAALNAPAWWTTYDDTVRSRTAPETVGFPSRVAVPTPAMLRASGVLGPLATVGEVVATLGAAHPVARHDARWSAYEAQHWKRTPPGFPGLEWVNGGDGQYVFPTVDDNRTDAGADGHVPAIPGTLGSATDDYAVWRSYWYGAGGGVTTLNFYDRLRLYLTQYGREQGAALLRNGLVIGWHFITQGHLANLIAGGPSQPGPFYWQPEGLYLYYLLTRATCAKDCIAAMTARANGYVSVFNRRGVPNIQSDPRDQSRILGAFRVSVLVQGATATDDAATLVGLLAHQWVEDATHGYMEPAAGRAVIPFGWRTGDANFAPDGIAPQGFMVPVIVDEWLNLRRSIPEVIGPTYAAKVLTEVPKFARYLLERASTAGVLMTYDGQSLPRRAYWNYWLGDAAPDKSGNWDLMRMIGSLFAVAWRITGDSTLGDEALQIQTDAGSHLPSNPRDDWMTSHPKSFNESWFLWGLTSAMFVHGTEF